MIVKDRRVCTKSKRAAITNGSETSVTKNAVAAAMNFAYTSGVFVRGIREPRTRRLVRPRWNSGDYRKALLMRMNEAGNASGIVVLTARYKTELSIRELKDIERGREDQKTPPRMTA